MLCGFYLRLTTPHCLSASHPNLSHGIHVQTLTFVDLLSLTFLISIVLLIRGGLGHVSSVTEQRKLPRQRSKGSGGRAQDFTLVAMEGKPAVNPHINSS
jgi:hypothetical protein